jgi:hypothetical protein
MLNPDVFETFSLKMLTDVVQLGRWKWLQFEDIYFENQST